MNGLTHFDADGAAQMVDVSGKDITAREAIATSTITMLPATLALIQSGSAKKGDVLGVARLAGIIAAKKTHDLIPLCHPLAIAKVSVEFDIDESANTVTAKATVKTTGQTGVEMEALTAASIATLTIYDMVKAVDRAMVIDQTRVLVKDGGKSGRYVANP